MSTTEIAVAAPPKVSLVSKIAERYSVEPARMLETLKATAFKTEKPVSNEQMMALLIVADQYHLNPFTREIFAFPDKGGIVPVVSIDGWARIINEHPMMDGIGFAFDDPGNSMTCTIWRKDRSHPIVVTEYMTECERGTSPWKSHPRRMLRHKAAIQCARLAFGFAGIFDEDEAQRIVTAGTAEIVTPVASITRIRQELAAPRSMRIEPVAVAEASAPIAPAPGKSFALYFDLLLHATDPDAAAQVMDEARTALPPDQLAELGKSYQAKFSPTNVE